MTESSGGIAGTNDPEENRRYGSTGRIAANTEAKIVDTDTGESLGPGQRGELWLRGPTIMKGIPTIRESSFGVSRTVLY